LGGDAGLQVTVLQLGDAGKLSGDALQAFRDMEKAGIEARPFSPDGLAGVDVIVDAVFGTGLDRDVSGAWAAAIDTVNIHGKPVLALDIPSGLHADTGVVMGAAVRATATISFIGLKQGMLTEGGRDCCGELLFSDLEVPREVYEQVAPTARRITLDNFHVLLAPRPRNAHKGRNGHVLVVGGDSGMLGAARMAGEAAGRAGAGLVSIATRRSHAASIAAVRPELMVHGIESAVELAPLLAKATVVAIGPGLGQSAWSRELLGAVLDSRRPLVVDADALNLLAHEPVKRDNWVLTPHPGEAARLLNQSAAAIQRDRFAAITALQRKLGGIVVLKGAGSLVRDAEGPTAVCDHGNPGMASGGMGDVLTGVIAGLAAQGLTLYQAAQAGVCIHGAAADQAARQGERGMRATDLMPHLRTLVNP
jgi:NAD(P)H-hydrate epimerase